MKNGNVILKALCILLMLCTVLSGTSCGLYERITDGIDMMNDGFGGGFGGGFGQPTVDVGTDDWYGAETTGPDDWYGADTAEEIDHGRITGHSISYTPFYLGHVFDEDSFYDIKVIYEDGAEVEWTGGYTVEPEQLTEPGEQWVTVFLRGSDTDFQVELNVKEPEIVGVSLITNSDTRTEYEVGESIDPRNFTLEVEYENGYTAYYEGDDLEFSPDEFTESGEQFVDVGYGGHFVPFEVYVDGGRRIVDITVFNEPSKMTYTVGEEFDLTGLVLEVLYSDGNYEYVGWENRFEVAPTSDISFDEPGDYPILFYYRGEPFEICFTVTKEKPVRLEISRLPDINIYTVGDSGIDVGGIELTLHYADGSSEEYFGDFTYTEPSLSTAGVKTVTVTVMGLDAKYNIEVKQQKRITGYSVRNIPATTYTQGDTLNTNGMYLVVNYSDGSTKNVYSGFTCSPTRLDYVGIQTVTVSYGGYTASFNVDVKSKVKTVSYISMASGPHATSYTKGSALMKDGIAINVYYTDGTSEVVTSGFTCSPELLNRAGEQTVTVNYKGKTATFTVNVVSFEKTLNSISIVSKPIKLGYKVGESLNTNGLAIVASYSDGTNENIVGGYTCSPMRFDRVGTQTVTVEYKGKVATFKVEVN